LCLIAANENTPVRFDIFVAQIIRRLILQYRYLTKQLIQALLILSLLFYLLSVSADPLLSKANEALDYLENKVIGQKNFQFSEDKAVAAIDDLSAALTNLELMKDSVLLIKITRANASYSLNAKRLSEGKMIDVEMALMALKDIQYAAVRVSNVELSDLLFTAGHIALHHIKDNIQAYDYWRQCAELNHVGCLNIVANDSFTGYNGATIDIKQSIYWHKRVVASGTKYTCAGVYSAQTLMKYAYILPNIDTGKNWIYWRAKRDELFQEVKQFDGYDDWCGESTILLNDYVLLTSQGLPAAALLDKMIAIEKDQQYIPLIESIKRGPSLPETLNLIKALDNRSTACMFTIYTAFIAKYQEKQQVQQALAQYLYTFDQADCSLHEMQFIQRLRDQGRW